jgi:hypothetical protein
LTRKPATIETFHTKTADGRLWLEVNVDGKLAKKLGPFPNKQARDAATRLLHDVLNQTNGAVVVEER